MAIPVACECGQRFVAQPHLAGKRVRCPSCGATMIVSSGKTCPACQAAMPDNGVFCTACGFDLRTGRKIKAASQTTPEPDTCEVLLPSRVRVWLFSFGNTVAGAPGGLAFLLYLQGQASLGFVFLAFIIGILFGLPIIAAGDISRRYLVIEKNRRGQLRAFIRRYLVFWKVADHPFNIGHYDRIKIDYDNAMGYTIAFSGGPSDFTVGRTVDDDEMRYLTNRLKNATGYEITR